MADRQGAFAGALRTRDGSISVDRFIIERAGAAELLVLGRLIDQILVPTHSDAYEVLYSEASAAGLSGYRIDAIPRPPGPGVDRSFKPVPMESLAVADDRREYAVGSPAGMAMPALEAMVAALARPPAPEGLPALFGMQVDLTSLVGNGYFGPVPADRALPKVTAEAALRSTVQGDLTLEIVVPTQRAALLLREADIRSLPYLDEAAPKKSQR